MEYAVVDAQISPEGRLAVLSKSEVSKLLGNGHGGLFSVFRNCSLAVLNCGNDVDDGKELLLCPSCFLHIAKFVKIDPFDQLLMHGRFYVLLHVDADCATAKTLAFF